MRNLIYWFICSYGKSKPVVSEGDKALSDNIAVDISFGTIGYALVLSRTFRSVSACLLW